MTVSSIPKIGTNSLGSSASMMNTLLQFKVLCLKLCVQPQPLLIICCTVYFDSIYARLNQYVHIEHSPIQSFVFELCVQPSPLLIICCIVYFDSIYAINSICSY